MEPTVINPTPGLISAAATAFLSLVFRYIPGLRDWLDTKTPEWKQLFMLGSTVIVAAAIGLWNMYLVGYSQSSLFTLAFAVMTSLFSNQTTYQYTKRSNP